MKQRGKKNAGGLPPPRSALPRIQGCKLQGFRLFAMVFAPLFFLFLAEAALRLGGYGYPTAFLLPSANHGQKTWIQNNQFGWRFFGKRKSRTPEAISILQTKPPGVTRIFVFGESAAFGDPQPAFGFPRVLQATLSLRHPKMKFEVVNAAMTAINSHVILPIARDCARANGDVWVIYMGNNEVVGPFGAGTVFGGQAPPLSLVRASLAMKTTRLVQALDDLREGWQKPPPEKSEWGGMLMFLDQKVPEDDPRLNQVCRSFEENLSDIIRIGHESGAGIVAGTVAVNLKDCAPFASLNHRGLSEVEQKNCDKLAAAGIQAQDNGKFSEAAAGFLAATQLDPASADLQFRLGQCLLASGDFQGAQKSLDKARDLDVLRFRCDSRLNRLIRKTVEGREQEHILMADVESSFAAISLAGVPGRDLFYEHVHLTFEGNCLLARAFADQIEKLLTPGAAAGAANWPTGAECAARLGRSDRDLQSAIGEVLARLTDPPFTTQINHDEQVRYLFQKASEAGSATTMADALLIARNAVKTAPEDARLHIQISKLESESGHDAAAADAAGRAVDLLPSSEEAWSQLGSTFVQQKRYEDAANAYRKAFRLNPQDVWPLQNLAMSLVKLGKTSEAQKEFEHALAITPRFGLAWLGFGQLLEQKNDKKAAGDCYQKALQNRIHRAPELATLARFCMSRKWFEAATTNYDDAIKLDPANATLRQEAGEAHFLLGTNFGKAGKTDEAAREFSEAAHLMPELIEARLNLGIALFKGKRWEESEKAFKIVVSRSQTNTVARHYLELLDQRTIPSP